MCWCNRHIHIRRTSDGECAEHHIRLCGRVCMRVREAAAMLAVSGSGGCHSGPAANQSESECQQERRRDKSASHTQRQTEY